VPDCYFIGDYEWAVINAKSYVEEGLTSQAISIGCFDGDAAISLADGTLAAASQIQVGDQVMSGAGIAVPVNKVFKFHANKMMEMVPMNGTHITTKHPVLHKGKWVHPYKIWHTTQKFVNTLYNFELGGKFGSDENTMLVNGVQSSTTRHSSMYGKQQWTKTCAEKLPLKATVVSGHNTTYPHHLEACMDMSR
jgi:hypothetical protein